jgi:hypothetical protein
MIARSFFCTVTKSRQTRRGEQEHAFSGSAEKWADAPTRSDSGTIVALADLLEVIDDGLVNLTN